MAIRETPKSPHAFHAHGRTIRIDPDGSIHVSCDGKWEVICRKNEWLAASEGQECAEVSDGLP